MHSRSWPFSIFAQWPATLSRSSRSQEDNSCFNYRLGRVLQEAYVVCFLHHIFFLQRNYNFDISVSTFAFVRLLTSNLEVISEALSWMERTDESKGFREPKYFPALRFAVSKSNVWDTDKVYACPQGFHCATLDEFFSYIATRAYRFGFETLILPRLTKEAA